MTVGGLKKTKRAVGAAKPIDLFREHKNEYAATGTPRFVVVKPAQYLAISGRGGPGGPAFLAAIAALFGVAFTIKMTRKHKLHVGPDYKIAPLEGFYWLLDDRPLAESDSSDELLWMLAIRTPDFITPQDVGAAAETLVARRKGPEVRNVRVERMAEGRAVQMLHVGPYDAEGPTVETMRQFATSNGVSLGGRHHEIYLSDPQRVPPERLKTIIRMPVG